VSPAVLASQPGVASSAAAAPDPAALHAAIAAVPDPEVPVITIEDLGILRSITADEATRTALVVITPTYSGCPAMDAIARRVEHAARRGGWTATVQTQLTPAWTTDWMSAAGRDKLREAGIAPPGKQASEVAPGPVRVGLSVRRVTCPLCGSEDTHEIARFGSTACKALRRCNDCREPFDEFKAI
jgi:ring-1,2-phenylacetyl-CoA epoxidase subunit PaaD